MNEYLIILAGVLLRIAIPLAVLLGLALLLGRMDARWKQESLRQEKELAVTEQSAPDCWEVKNCSVQDMAACPARKSTEPCWQVFRQDNGDFHPDCLTCEVFLSAAGPVPEIVTNH